MIGKLGYFIIGLVFLMALVSDTMPQYKYAATAGAVLMTLGFTLLAFWPNLRKKK